MTIPPKIIGRGGDPLKWSAAAARDRVRQSMRSAPDRHNKDRSLADDLGQALKDDYVRRGSKKARNWPHKKKEKPPGNPKIRLASVEQRRMAKRLKVKNEAA